MKRCQYQNECEEILKDGTSRMYMFNRTGAPAKFEVTFRNLIQNAEFVYECCTSCKNELEYLCSCEPNEYQHIATRDIKTGKMLPTEFV